MWFCKLQCSLAQALKLCAQLPKKQTHLTFGTGVISLKQTCCRQRHLRKRISRILMLLTKKQNYFGETGLFPILKKGCATAAFTLCSLTLLYQVFILQEAYGLLRPQKTRLALKGCATCRHLNQYARSRCLICFMAVPTKFFMQNTHRKNQMCGKNCRIILQQHGSF